MCGDLFALRHIPLHLIAAARVQPVSRLEKIHRCAHERIDCFRSEMRQHVTFRFTTKITKRIGIDATNIFFVFAAIFVVYGPSRVLHSFPRGMRQVIGRQREFLAQLGVETFERGRQFALDALARAGFVQFRKR